jgi:uncharacterized protein YbjT (DUF2867 family)
MTLDTATTENEGRKQYMNIFLTGASGYIGCRVAEKLQAAGHQIVGLARSEHAVQWMQEQGITPHRGDLFDAPSLTQVALLADGVIHLGAAAGPAWAEGNRIAVHALLDALAGSGKPFVYTSGTPIYGETGLSVVAEFFAMNQQVSGAKATLLLGWNPQAPSLLYDVAYGSYRTAKGRSGAQ